MLRCDVLRIANEHLNSGFSLEKTHIETGINVVVLRQALSIVKIPILCESYLQNRISLATASILAVDFCENDIKKLLSLSKNSLKKSLKTIKKIKQNNDLKNNSK